MKYHISLLLSIVLFSCVSEKEKVKPDLSLRYEKSNFTETATYKETIDFYIKLADYYETVKLDTFGKTDSGEPLHLVTFSADKNFDYLDENKIVLLINNGIHPGEPDGIDATMLLLRDLAEGKIKSPENVIVSAIPVYNIGGCLNRNSYSRANQNGPVEYGFRGNARNYDLNRDFMKNDTKNALAFTEIFHAIQASVYIENHVSNGADYQYTLTHLFSQHNKLGYELGDYMLNKLQTNIETDLKNQGIDCIPYVNIFGQTPEAGYAQFMDYPRYSSGYVSLFHSLGLVVETHMLKPYKDRVEKTYAMMETIINLIDVDFKNIKSLQKKQEANFKVNSTYVLDWEIDSSKVTNLPFKGYEANYKPSEISGNMRLYYDQNKPYEKEIPYYNFYKAKTTVIIPQAYVIPQGWHTIISQLEKNKIKMERFDNDTSFLVEVYHIDHFQTTKNPYEGHYFHYQTKIKKSEDIISFRKGDYIIYTQQKGVRYLLESLEPEGPDSFFNWNFFDPILQQKEHFSSYVFEEIAVDLLNKDAALKNEFEELKKNNPDFQSSSYLQLEWIYKRSPYYEKTHLRYPIFRLI